MQEVVLFGSGNNALKYINQYDNTEKIVAAVDNNSSKWGEYLNHTIPIISLEDYKQQYSKYKIIITIFKCDEIIKQLEKNNIENYEVYEDMYLDPQVKVDHDIDHGHWLNFLSARFNRTGMTILEIGSRVVTGANNRSLFSKAEYTGFDLYDGPNVDIVGDAHKLSEYFGGKKFDLIFSSAVFEHLAMPWKVSIEITKLLNVGGYVFIETHYSFGSHERPWHFFQFSENALDVLFPKKFGMECIKKGVSNPIMGEFMQQNTSPDLKGNYIIGLYCHSEYLGKKVEEVKNLSWDSITTEDVVHATTYPKPKENV